MVLKMIVILLLSCNLVFACEFGKTYKDFYGKPTKSEIRWCEQEPEMYDYYNGECLHEIKEMTEDVAISTGYTWCGMQNPPPKGKEPYVLYKGHRWYPQYHGIIYVYQDGREVK